MHTATGNATTRRSPLAPEITTARLPLARRLALTLPLLAALAACSTPAGSAPEPQRTETTAAADTAPVPGWFLGSLQGAAPQDYEAAIVTEPGRGNVARLSAAVPEPTGFGTLMQEVQADAYRGRRVRLSADIRTGELGDLIGAAGNAGAAFLWLRVDGQGSAMAFDNMGDRGGIPRASDWQRHSLVLDVPDGADGLAYGVFIMSTGSVWMDDVELEVVGDDVPTTGMEFPPSGADDIDVERMRLKYDMAPAAPVNTGFERRP